MNSSLSVESTSSISPRHPVRTPDSRCIALLELIVSCAAKNARRASNVIVKLLFLFFEHRCSRAAFVVQQPRNHTANFYHHLSFTSPSVYWFEIW